MLGRANTCCFTGHRPEKLPWGTREDDPRCTALKQRLSDVLEAAYGEGMRHFICGMARGCDFYFAEAVLALREKYGDIVLEAAVPCRTQTDKWPEKDIRRWENILRQCDMETMVQTDYTRGCMLRRNRYMVDHSALVIAVFDGSTGGTRFTLDYAMRNKIPFVDIPPVMRE